ncbi:extracellular solute-binding protein [Gracilibacillus salitolerans]|uniref:Extracellular solute-binding protein n=1 Tax=Gracilibacillus salitolerans TaxID=2663022 RepID=A0A5Q2THW8_9BACI|nr:extracellular solute-binding protein [Gracilibacillus salitolerans]QGH33553.1 extracellular solute-binding protein [Gracilibacillus salitolerans]
MRIERKWFVMVIVLCLALGALLAGCTSKESSETVENETESNESNENSQNSEKPQITSSIYDRGSVPAAEGSIEDNRWTKWIKQNGPVNVKYQPIPRWESTEKFNTLFASGQAPDLLFEYSAGPKDTWYQQKQLMPLGEIIEEHSTDYKQMLEDYPALRKAGTLSDGKLYFLGRLNEITPIRAMFVRKDWLDKLNLEVPETTEELYQVAKAFTEQDPDGNGEDDTYGIAISHQSARTIDQVFQNMGFVMRNDQIVRAWDSAVEATKFRKRLYQEGIVDRDYLNDNNGEKARKDFVTGKLGIYPLLLKWDQFAKNELKSLKQNVPEAEIIPIAYPESPAGSFNPTYQNPVQMTAAVSRGAKNPEAVIKFVDFLVKPSTANMLNFGEEGVHHELDGNGCPKIMDGEHNEEVGYMTDATMLSSSSFVTEGKCGYETMFNPEIPNEKEGLELYEMSREVYFDLSRPYSEITHSEHMPQLPKELDITLGQTGASIDELWVKAIVSGSDYTVEQALKDAKKIWQNGRGPDAEQWWSDWYAENKDSAFLAKDIYGIVEQQQAQK